MWGKYGKRWKWKRRGVSIDEIAYANREEGTLNVYMFFSFLFFFYQGFLSRTLTTHRIAGEDRGPSFIPLYHFHPLTNIETFICNFACIYQTATRWDVPPYRITIWLIDVTLSFCLFTWWFDSSFFCYSNLRRETGGFELTSTITLILQANRLTKCASQPKCVHVRTRERKG